MTTPTDSLENDTSQTARDDSGVEFAELPSEDEVEVTDQHRFTDAVLHATDWTTETIISQLRRGNIVLNPSFQRRDAWKPQQKSRFIESLILGLPIPQIVLAEAKDRRGKFIVLDGKQRLLALLQFWGLGQGAKNAYALSGLEVRKELMRKRLKDIEEKTEFEDDLNALLNQPIRTVVIKNWPSIDFLHLVFLRLNTGSVKLSPQELRQALFPGPFSDWIDEAASNSTGIKRLLKLKEPDYRMRDIEVVARFLAFRFFLSEYRGRMKKFLDHGFEQFNDRWDELKPELEAAMAELEAAVEVLAEVFGDDIAKKPGSRHFNRAIFDFLIVYAQDAGIRDLMRSHKDDIRRGYETLFSDAEFRATVERDTAGVPNTVTRIARWGSLLAEVTGESVPVPTVADTVDGDQRVEFAGF